MYACSRTTGYSQGEYRTTEEYDIESVNNFIYLRSLITSDTNVVEEVKSYKYNK